MKKKLKAIKKEVCRRQGGVASAYNNSKKQLLTDRQFWWSNIHWVIKDWYHWITEQQDIHQIDSKAPVSTQCIKSAQWFSSKKLVQLNVFLNETFKSNLHIVLILIWDIFQNCLRANRDNCKNRNPDLPGEASAGTMAFSQWRDTTIHRFRICNSPFNTKELTLLESSQLPNPLQTMLNGKFWGWRSGL